MRYSIDLMSSYMSASKSALNHCLIAGKPASIEARPPSPTVRKCSPAHCADGAPYTPPTPGFLLSRRNPYVRHGVTTPVSSPLYPVALNNHGTLTGRAAK